MQRETQIIDAETAWDLYEMTEPDLEYVGDEEALMGWWFEDEGGVEYYAENPDRNKEWMRAEQLASRRLWR